MQFLRKICLPIAITWIFSTLLSTVSGAQGTSDYLYKGFTNPPAEARPFVRWWWNGNYLETNEIKRQLNVIHQAGFGGIEINPIAMPDEVKDTVGQPLTWLSKDWNLMLKTAASEARKKGMITDIIVGSGWPFGGEFLKKEETIQRVLAHTIPVKGGDHIKEDVAGLFKKADEALVRRHHETPLSNRIFYIKLVPENIQGVDECIDLTAAFREKQQLDYIVPPGKYTLSYGILQHGHRKVMHGAPGAAGPVMNHYDKKVTLAYLSRLKKISDDTGVLLRDMIRALFCDSIELAGANWTDGLPEIFAARYGYRLEPYFPFIFYEPGTGYVPADYNEAFYDALNRVRFDYNKLLVDNFLDNFLKPFQQYCTDNGLLCRYQAYGTPFLMGIMEGNLVPDIPESNNWLYTTNMDSEAWTWNQGHGYMIWNLYASSAGHLKGRKIISCESMTNLAGVFRSSLEEIKQHDDMNFITGINHAIVHGYNYSPPSAGFPGWVRYGSYFSEQNTWWPYLRNWVDYNARLSFVFQNSQPVKQIAVMSPAGDIWSEKGLSRRPFHETPWYIYRVWESLSQAGSSCDYINEQIITDADVTGGLLSYGPMKYEAVLLADVKSIRPETAKALLEYVRHGGKLIFANSTPFRSLSLKEAAGNDALVSQIIKQILDDYPQQVIQLAGPATEAELMTWTKSLLKQAAITPHVGIVSPSESVYQIRKRAGEQDILFFVNSHRSQVKRLSVDFNFEGKTPWIWNPENGTKERAAFPVENGKMLLELDPLQSLLLVFGPGQNTTDTPAPPYRKDEAGTELTGSWQVQFSHVDGSRFTRNFPALTDFGNSEDSLLSTFAGTVTYKTVFRANEKAVWLEIEKAHRGIVEVYLNGQPIGTRWYGRLKFQLKHLVPNGENRLEIRYTTVLANYTRSLKDNPVAKSWNRIDENIPMGIVGKVMVNYEL